MNEADDIDDAKSREVRNALGELLPVGLAAVGRVLWVGGTLIGPDRVTGESPFNYGRDAVAGLGIVVQTAGALTAGIRQLDEAGNVYSASALLRQLVEVEYLSWAFAEDHEEAERWLRSTNHERRNTWQPRHLRARSQGKFRGSDYGFHCEMAGHPTPRAARLLPDHTPWPEWFVALELAVHGASIWDYVQVAVEQNGYQDVVASDQARDVTVAVERWRSTDAVLPRLRALHDAEVGDTGDG